MKKFTLISLALLVIAHVSVAQDSTDQPLYNRVQFALQSKQFTDAVAQIDVALATGDEQRDYLLYLKGLALFYNEDYTNAIQACNLLLTAHPNSAWLRKATFLRAKCHFNLKAFEQAEVIYSAEVDRLLSSERKSEIAQVYIELAEALSRKPEKGDLDAPPPNYQKAYKLYQKVLTLEIDRDLREVVTFRLGRMMQLQDKYQQAANDYQTYLAEFDSGFRRSSGSVQRTETNKPPGSHRYQARYHLAECQLAMDQHLPAQFTLEDLVKLIDDEKAAVQPLLKDARFLLTRTYQFPAPGSDEALELGVQCARRFQGDFPDDRRSMTLAHEIAEAYQQRGRSEEALAAYQDFLDNKGFKVTPETRDTEDPSESFAEHHHRLRMSATFQIGAIRFGQRKYTDAIEAWNRYIREFPNGPQWTDAQQQIINAEFQLGVTLLAEEKYDEVVRALDQFQAKHPLDGRVRQIMLIYGQIHLHNAEPLPAIAAWEKLVSKYPNSDESSLALFRIGQTYEEKMGDLENALESYRKLTWGQWHAQAQERIRRLTKKHLKLVTERTTRTNEPAEVHVSLRNIETLTVNLYKLNLEAYWRELYDVKGVEDLDLALIAPDKTWEYRVPDYQKYKPFELDIDIPIEGAGVYAVQLGEADLESTTLLIRSDIEAITKTSRREVLVFVQDMLKGKVVADAKVLVSNGSQVIFEGFTGTDGVLHVTENAISDDTLGENRLKDASRVAAFVVKGGHVAADGLDLAGLGFSTGLTPRCYIYTDRPAYRPGDHVSIRGILRDVREGTYIVPDGVRYKLSVIDAQGRPIREEAVKLSQFGGFDTQMQLDADTPVGEYRIQVSPYDAKGTEHTFIGKFQVARFQLEKVQLTLDFPRDVYFRGEQVEATFSAQYYYGQPVKNARIQYDLPDGRSYTEETDDQGKLKVIFDTTLMQPGHQLHFRGTIVGENASVRDHVMLAHLEFSIAIKPDADLVLSGEPFDVIVRTTGADGKPIGVKLAVKVVQQQGTPPEHPVLSQIPWLEGEGTAEPAEVTIQEHHLQTDNASGVGTIQLTLIKGGTYIVRASGIDRFGQAVIGSNRVTISDESDETKLRIFAERTKTEVGAAETLRIHSRLTQAHALVTFEGEGVIAYEVLALKSGMNPLQFTVGHAHFPNFYLGVAAIDGQQLRTAQKHFVVERRLNLKVSWKGDQPRPDYNFEPFPIYEPGATAEVEVRATDQLGKPVKAEFSLALVDEALFAIYSDTLTPINNFFQKGIQRESAMRTVSSCTFRYDPPTRQVIQEILQVKAAFERPAGLAMVEHTGATRDASGDVVVGWTGELQTSYYSAPGKASSKPQVRKPVIKPVLKPDIRSIRDWAVVEHVAAARIGPVNGSSEPGPLHVREEFTAAGHWIGAVITDDVGVATVTIPMPEKTTKWRLTGRGVTVDTLVGEVRVQAVARKDFFLDIQAPSIVTEGDKIRAHVRLHNLTDFEGNAEVQLTLTVDGARHSLRDHEQLTIKGQDTTELIFDATTVPAGDRLIIEVTATAGTMRDGIQREVPIRPWGLEYADTQSGTASGDRTVYVELPADQRCTRKGLIVSIGPNVSRLIFDLAMSHHSRWFQNIAIRSTVQMPGDGGSDLLALAHALGYVKKVGGQTTDNRELLARARTHVGQLVTTQNRDGGWSWIGRGLESHPRVTSRNLWAMAAARQAGVAVDYQTIVRTIAYLKTAFAQIDQKDNDTKAVILHALSTLGEADFAYANRLYRQRNQMTDAALAYTALVFVNLERLEIAGEMLSVLERRDPLSAPSPLQRGEKIFPSFTGSGRVETIALTLLGLEAVRPNSPWVKQAVEYLIGQRRYYGYSPYTAKGPVVAALATYYQETQYTADDYKLSVLVNGEVLETIVVRQDSANRLIDVPIAHIIDGQNSVEMRIDGRGTYTYLVTLNGFSPLIPSWVGTELKTAENWKKTQITRRYHHAPLEYEGRPIEARSTTQITQLETGMRTDVAVDISPGKGGILFHRQDKDRHLVIDEYFPAGTTVVDGSVKGDFRHYELGDGVIHFHYKPGGRVRRYTYQLISYAPGEYRVLPTVIRDALHPGDMWLGTVASLTVLGPGEKSPDQYHMNDNEAYTLGKAYFDDGRYSDALPLLERLHADSSYYNKKETVQMLLWMYTTKAHYNARKVVEAFELSRERYPELYIPFDKIRAVGAAYRDIGEFERATFVHRSTIESSFVNDANVSATLQDEGKFLRSLGFMEELWHEYPDTAATIPAYFALSQALYARKDEKIQENRDGKSQTVTKQEILARTAETLSQFLTLYPTNPLADDAGFSLANVLMDVEDFETAVQLCQLNQARYPESQLLSSFQYMEALGFFSLHAHEKAIGAATTVASSESEDRDFARYILGQIYHVQEKPEQAITWYSKVRKIYPDADESIAHFEAQRIALPEVTIKRPDTAVALTLKYRNIKTAVIQVYRVDLMKLYLREKNLSRVTQARLAGIEPAVSQVVPLGDGKDYIDKSHEIALPLTEEGAYLVICRGDNLLASGLILITPLEIEVQEGTVSGRVRVNVRNVVAGKYQSKVHVKAVGSAAGRFITGETDLRGIFIADGLRGTATVIARDAENRYAFYRGTASLGLPHGKAQPARQDARPREATDYRRHLERKNRAIQSKNVTMFDQLRRSTRGGVQVQSTY